MFIILIINFLELVDIKINYILYFIKITSNWSLFINLIKFFNLFESELKEVLLTILKLRKGEDFFFNLYFFFKKKVKILLFNQ